MDVTTVPAGEIHPGGECGKQDSHTEQGREGRVVSCNSHYIPVFH